MVRKEYPIISYHITINSIKENGVMNMANTKGLMLVGEPMGLFIAQSEGSLDEVTGYSCAVAGAEFNVAVCLSRLEHPVGYLTKLGEDPFGKLIRNVLNRNKISTDLVSWSKEASTGFMLKSKVSKGDPEIFYFRKNSAASTLSCADIDKVDFSNYSNIHMTGIFPALSGSTKKAAFYLIDKAKENGLTISFDPNLRPQLWPSTDIMVDTLNQLATKCDIILPGENEGLILCGSKDPEVISDFYISKGAKTVVVKLGSKGAYYSTGTENGYVSGYKVEKVVDTVGAGDGFAGGMISGLMEGMTLKDAIKRGNAVGAIQVMSIGDNDGLPTRNELTAFMNQ